MLSCFSHVQPCATLWTVAHQAPLSMGILQGRILEWVDMPSSRKSSWLRDQTQVSCIAGRFFTIWATREAPRNHVGPKSHIPLSSATYWVSTKLKVHVIPSKSVLRATHLLSSPSSPAPLPLFLIPGPALISQLRFIFPLLHSISFSPIYLPVYFISCIVKAIYWCFCNFISENFKILQTCTFAKNKV